MTSARLGRTSAVPVRLRAFVAGDTTAMANVLTASTMLEWVATSLPRGLTEDQPSLSGRSAAAVRSLRALYQRALATEDRVLVVAAKFERADHRAR